MGAVGVAWKRGQVRKKIVTPKRANLLFPTPEQMQFVRQLCKSGLLQKYPYYGRYEKKIVKGCFKRLDNFLKTTDRNMEKNFSSLLEEMP